MPPFRDDHILIISPGSTTILAQLGLPESFTPAKVRIPSRMFPGVEENTWTPNKIREFKEEDAGILGSEGIRKKRKTNKDESSMTNGTPIMTATDTTSMPTSGTGTPAIAQGQTPHMNGAPSISEKPIVSSGPTKEIKSETTDTKPAMPDTTMVDVEDGDAEMDNEEGDDDENDNENDEDEEGDEEEGGDDEEGAAEANEENAEEKIYYEDDDDEEDAVWCLKEGKVTNWPCFFALLTHVHELINPTFHTPILMLSQPCWTLSDKERVCQFVFEKLKTPGFALLDSSLAVTWAYGIPTGTVIDVGYQKTDVTPIVDFLVQDLARTTISIGGDDLNKHLKTLLPHLSDDQIEQLKKSNICEILPPGVPLPGEAEAAKIAAALAAANGKVRGEEDQEEEDGVTNIAAILASGKTQEYLAKKEKEKAEKKAGAVVEKKQPNYKKERNSFMYIDKNAPMEEGEVVEVHDETENMDVDGQEPPQSIATNEAAPQVLPVDPPIDLSAPPVPELDTTNKDTELPEAPSVDTGSEQQPPTELKPQNLEINTTAPAAQTSTSIFPSADMEDDDAKRARDRALKKEEKRKNKENDLAPGQRRVEIEIGVERFKAAEGGILHTIADTVYRCIEKVDEISKRSECWDNVIVVGNGSRIRGFKEALLATITSKYVVSPSSSIFTSEMPSHFSTPMGTGANTPQPSSFNPSAPSQGGNPLLLQAAHNAAAAALAAQHQHHSTHHAQMPSNVKTTKAPEYFPEWKDVGFEECSFLGAQVAAKVLFVVDQGTTKGFVTRVEYNEIGPQAIHSI